MLLTTKEIIRRLIISLCICTSFIIVAQDIKVKSFSLLIEPMTVPIQRKDNNGNVCALVKVIIPSAQASFEGSIIGNCDFKTSEYWCYLSPGSKMLKIKCPGCVPCLVNFESLIGKSLESQRIYELNIEASKLTNQEITDSIVSVDRMRTLMKNLTQVRVDNVCFRRGKLYPYVTRENGFERYGFLDLDLKVAFPTNYSYLMNESYLGDVDNSVDIDYYWVKDFNGFWGLIDSNGKKITPFKYTRIYEPNDELLSSRIVLAIDSIQKGYVLNRITGDIISRIPEWDFVENSSGSLLKYTDIKKHKDYFIDKYTGQSRDIKIPKGYYFKRFLPFNHLLIQKDKSLDSKIMNFDGSVVSEHSFYKRVQGDYDNLIPPKFLFGILGIYDLERESYIYNGGAISEYFYISSNVICIKEGVHTRYLTLDSGALSDTMPNIGFVKPNESQLQLIRNGINKTFRNSHIVVIPIEDGIYLANLENKKILINKYGTFINEELTIDVVQNWQELIE